MGIKLYKHKRKKFKTLNVLKIYYKSLRRRILKCIWNEKLWQKNITCRWEKKWKKENLFNRSGKHYKLAVIGDVSCCPQLSSDFSLHFILRNFILNNERKMFDIFLETHRFMVRGFGYEEKSFRIPLKSFKCDITRKPHQIKCL